MSLFAELKRRNVFRVGIAYLLLGWVVLQAADFALDLVDAPNWVMQVFFIAVMVGWPFALFFAWAFEMTPEGIKRESEVDRANSTTRKTGRSIDFFIIGVLLLIIAFLGIERMFFAGSVPARVTGQDIETGKNQPAKATEKSIAVLPFVNMSSDPEQEYFSDGISEEILNAVAQVQDLRVAGRTSSFAFKGQNEDLRSIGEKLGVSHILEGSVRKSGDRVRITAQLIQVEDGFHLWSETFDRQLTDVFAIQDEISLAVLEALKAQLGANHTINATPVDLAVYDKYLLARQKMRERAEAPLLEAAALLDQVIAADPSYAPALAQRGITELLLSQGNTSYGSIPIQEAVENGRRWLLEAERLDPELPEAHAGLGLAHTNVNELAEAEARLLKALALNPSFIDASNWLQQVYIFSGRIEESHALTQRIHALDPLYLPGIVNVAFGYLIRGDSKAAEAVVQESTQLFEDPPPAQLRSLSALCALFDQREAEAVRISLELGDERSNYGDPTIFSSLFALMDYEGALEHGEGLSMSLVALGRLGRTEEALQLARTMALHTAGASEYISFLDEAGLHEELINYVENGWPSLDALEGAFNEAGFGAYMMGNIAHAYLVLENQQGFADAMKRMRAALDSQAAQGANNRFLTFSNAHYYMLLGDQQSALEHMERAVAQGFLEDNDFTRYQTVFAPLRGEPRFEALVARMNTRRNEQRALLSLPPLDVRS